LVRVINRVDLIGGEQPEFIPLLREHHIAMVVAGTAGKWPLIGDVTADFISIRLHGADELYASGYTGPALDEWARKIRCWSKGGTPENARLPTPLPPTRKQGREVFTYFDNDVKTHVPFDAISPGKRFRLTSLWANRPFPSLGKTGRAWTLAEALAEEMAGEDEQGGNDKNEMDPCRIEAHGGDDVLRRRVGDGRILTTRWLRSEKMPIAFDGAADHLGQSADSDFPA
jgi:hypothetical protein